jgi:hypothetical protein
MAFFVFAALSAGKQLTGHPIRVRWQTLALAQVAVVVTYFGMVALWGRLLSNLGASLRYRDTLRLWSFSNLGRYIPGKIWQVVGLATLARDMGVTAGLAVSAAVIAIGLMLCTGALVGFLLLPDLGPRYLSAGAVVALAAALLVPVARPGWIGGGLRRLPRSFGQAHIAPIERRTVVQWIGLFSVAWLAHGAGFALLAAAFGEVGWRDAVRLAGAFSLAYVGGLLAVFAPGGIGVREGILGEVIASLGTDLPSHVVAVASRLWAMAGELVVLAAAVWVHRRSGSGAP